MRKALALAIGAVLLAGTTATAAPIMYVHDSNGVLARVDVVTGTVNVIGNMGQQMTDIAFDPSGNLFGITFGALFSIDRTTAASTFIGNHAIPGGNALVFRSDGTLYGAGFQSDELFTVNPASGATASLGVTGFSSGGDLAFHAGNFYLADSMSRLVQIDLSNLGLSSVIGPFGIANVFGLASGDDGVLYGVGGTEIFTVNTTTGASTSPVDYAGQGLSVAFGQSFFTESGAPPEQPIPEPGSLLLMGTGLAAFARRLRRRS